MRVSPRARGQSHGSAEGAKAHLIPKRVQFNWYIEYPTEQGGFTRHPCRAQAMS
jgi:hypothetical protein